MLGISIYPDKASLTEIKDYILLAKKYGYQRVFTCLISAEGTKDEIKAMITESVQFAKSNGMEVYVDIVADVFKKLEVKENDLSFFAEIGAAGIRVDFPTNGMNEALLTHNTYGLNVEINMSQDTHFIDTLMDYRPTLSKLQGSFNFYPQKYTGMMLEDFISSAKRFKKYNLRTAAFVSSEVATDGPWPIMEGMPTLEMHRGLPIEIQAKHLKLLNLVDDIIISNQFASEDELRKLAQTQSEKIKLTIDLCSNVSETEYMILEKGTHFLRGDRSEYLIRSIMPRFEFKKENVEANNTQHNIERGTVVVGNNKFGQYKAEVQIVLKDIVDDNLQRNVVGKIAEQELFLLSLIDPWQAFEFEIRK